MENSLLRGCVQELQLQTALDCVPSLLLSNNAKAISDHIDELNYRANAILDLVKPVALRCDKEGRVETANQLRQRYLPLSGPNVNEAIAKLKVRLSDLSQYGHTKLESNLLDLLQQLDNSVYYSYSDCFSNSVNVLNNSISEIDKLKDAIRSAVQNLKLRYIDAGRHENVKELDNYEPKINSQCDPPIRALRTRLSYLEHRKQTASLKSEEAQVTPQASIQETPPKCVVDNLIDVSSNKVIPVEQKVIALCSNSGILEPSSFNPETGNLASNNELNLSPAVCKLKSEYECSKESLQESLLTASCGRLLGPRVCEVRSFLEEFNSMTADFFTRNNKYVEALQNNGHSNTAAIIENQAAMFKEFDIPDALREITARLIELGEDPTSRNETNHNSEQPITPLKGPLDPPDEVLRKICDAKIEGHKLATNESNNLVQAQTITSDLLSSDVEVTRLVRRIAIKPEVIKSTYSKFVRPGTRRHLYPDVNYSRVLLRNKFQPLADLISDSILDGEISDGEDAESDNTSIFETKSISHASRVSSRSARHRKKRQRSYEPPPNLKSAVSGSTQSQRIRSHSTNAKQNRRAAVRRICHSIIRMDDSEVALYLHLHGVNDKAKQFFADCKPYLKLDASEFNLGKIEDPIQWISRCVYANERCDVTLEKFIQLYYVKSNRPVPWMRMLASAERINGKP